MYLFLSVYIKCNINERVIHVSAIVHFTSSVQGCVCACVFTHIIDREIFSKSETVSFFSLLYLFFFCFFFLMSASLLVPRHSSANLSSSPSSSLCIQFFLKTHTYDLFLVWRKKATSYSSVRSATVRRTANANEYTLSFWRCFISLLHRTESRWLMCMCGTSLFHRKSNGRPNFVSSEIFRCTIRKQLLLVDSELYFCDEIDRCLSSIFHSKRTNIWLINFRTLIRSFSMIFPKIE